MRSSFAITRSVIFALVLREMRGRFGRVRFGAVWVLVEPMAHLIVLGTIMSLRGSSSYGQEFLVWLLMGLAPFLLCKNIVLKLLGSTDANKALFSYKQIQPADAFFARVIVEFCIAAPVFLILYIGMTWYGLDTSIREPIAWLLYLFTGILFSFGLGVIFALLVEAIPESGFILKLLFIPLYLLSGIIFPLERLPRELAGYVLWNPYLHMVDLIRSATFENYRLFYGVSYSFLLTVTICTLFLSFSMYRARRYRLKAL